MRMGLHGSSLFYHDIDRDSIVFMLFDPKIFNFFLHVVNIHLVFPFDITVKTCAIGSVTNSNSNIMNHTSGS